MYREQREWGEVLVLRRRLKRVFRQRCLCAGQMMSREYATVLSVAERKIAVVDTELVFCKFLVSGVKKGNFGKYFKNIFGVFLAGFRPSQTHCLRGCRGANPYPYWGRFLPL
jgi:hypothetical protein